MGKPEGIVEDYLGTVAKQHDFLCYKFVSPGRRGVPDRVIIGHDATGAPRTIFIELKSATGTPSKQQLFIIDKMRKHGAEVHILSSKSEIDEFFKTNIRKEPHVP